MHLHSYLASAKKIIDEYDGSIPFAAWLKNFFKQNRKYGSKDRKFITGLCYCYFRLGNEFKNVDTEQRFLIGQFLCSDTDNIFLNDLRPEWNEKIALLLNQKLPILEKQALHIFPFEHELSDGIDATSFNLSFLIQPDLFLRVRPGNRNSIVKKLDEAGILFEFKDENCIAVANNTKIDQVLLLDKEAVIQDYNSQKTLQIFNSQFPTLNSHFTAWDCCAASGGKSILLKDIFPDIRLTVSDVRKSILINLQNRFKRAGIRNYNSFVVDVANSQFTIGSSRYTIVLCDAPCSGSGTWSRTPEQLSFFKEEKINYYHELQKKISIHASKAVEKNGYFLYITCSVFKKENEDVVEYIKTNTPLQLLAMQYLEGYSVKADTLFTALFQLQP